MGFFTHPFTVVVLLAHIYIAVYQGFSDVKAEPTTEGRPQWSSTVPGKQDHRFEGSLTLARPLSVSGHSSDSGNQRELLTTSSFTQVSGMSDMTSKLSDESFGATTKTLTKTFNTKDYVSTHSTFHTWPTEGDRNKFEPFTICDRNIVGFVRNFDLCNTSRLLSHESCKDRCGEKLGIVDSGRFCSCDDLCVVYSDCCMDFSEQCPQLARESEDFFKAEKMQDTKLGCDVELQYRTIIACNDASEDPWRFKGISTSTRTYTTWPTTHSYLTSTPARNENYANYHLSYFYRNDYNYVEDVSANLVFRDAAVHQCSKDPEKRSYQRIPYTFLITHDIPDGQSIQETVFPNGSYDHPAPYVDTPDNKLRGCYLDKIVDCNTCPFWNDKMFLTHVCKALKSENRMRNRDMMTGDGRYESQIDEPLINWGNCKLMSSTQKVNENLFSQRLVTTNGYDGKEPQKGSLVTIKPVSSSWEEYTVEFSKAPWKKLRCSDLNTVLDDCEIEACASDYYLTKYNKCQKLSHDSFTVKILGQQHDSEVITPITFPRCTCLKILFALTPFSLWTIEKNQISDNKCLIFTKPFLLHFLQDLDPESQYRNVNQTRSLTSSSVVKRKAPVDRYRALSGNVQNSSDIVQQGANKENIDYSALLYNRNIDKNSTDILTYSELREKLQLAISGAWTSCKDSYVEMDICFSSRSVTYDISDLCFNFTYRDFNDEEKQKNLAPVNGALSIHAVVLYNGFGLYICVLLLSFICAILQKY